MNATRRRFLAGTTALAAVLPVSAKVSDPCRVPQSWDETFDVVVVGAGGAGCAASISAAESGAKVILVEKNSYVGGNTILSGGGFNAAVKEDSEAAGVEDSPELHFEQTYAAGDRLAYPELLRTYTDHAPDTVRWLKSLGMKFRPIYQIYGGLWPRARSPIGILGVDYFKVCTPRMTELGVETRLDTRVLSFIREHPLEGRVLGVEVRTGKTVKTIRALKGVIVCTGGFAANAKLCARFDPRMGRLGTTNNAACSTGEALLAMEDIGAGTTGMSFIQCNPGPAPGKKVKCVMNQFVADFIFFNKEGKRFINEDARRDVMRDAVLAQTDALAFNMVDADGFERLKPSNGANNEKALANNALFFADTVEELATKLGVPPDALAHTIREFNAAVDAKKDPIGRAPSMLVNKLEKAPFYAGPITMARHHTMGGITVTTRGEVIDRRGEVIPGLFAAGEVTGGIHGTNRVGGNAVSEAFTMGRRAGWSAMGRLPEQS